jgi:AraC-like DNA-binding protein
VNQVRVNKACLMLMHSDRYVTSICYEVGFNNVSNFNRKFLEIKGVTPTEFRRQSQLRLEGAASSEN